MTGSPTVCRAAASCGSRGVRVRLRRPREEHQRLAHPLEDELRVTRVLDGTRARSQVARELVADAVGVAVGGQLVDHDEAAVGVARQDRLDEAPRHVDERRALSRPVRELRLLDLELRRPERRRDLVPRPLGGPSGRRDRRTGGGRDDVEAQQLEADQQRAEHEGADRDHRDDGRRATACGRTEPIGDNLKGAAVEVPAGVEGIPGLKVALPAK